MRSKILLLLMFFAVMSYAQEPYRQLIITQCYTQNPNRNFAQITNKGNQTINLKEFRFGTLGLNHPGIFDVHNDPWTPDGTDKTFMLPDHELAPGESFLITTAFDYAVRAYAKNPPAIGAREYPKQLDFYGIADLLIHMREENADETDSVSLGNPYHYNALNLWDGRNTIFLMHHFAEDDSAAIDQFGGVFDNGSGANFSKAYDVAGVTNATLNSNFVRKYKYDTGNLDFANARGVSDEDSEWIVLTYPPGHDYSRDLWWAIGTHGDYVLDENTLESDVIGIDFANKKLTVPWGIRRLDDIMRHMKKKPGLAWYYHLNDNSSQDSLYRSARTGDKLEVIVCGSEKQTAMFDIEVLPPTNDANIVVPMDVANSYVPGESGPIIDDRWRNGILAWPRVTTYADGNDTISGVNHGLPYALRTDSLLKRLEKAPNANWEFVFADGMERPDIKNGDKLKVIAQNGNVKEYYLKVRHYEPSHNALLNAITWPDIPPQYKGILGWTGDTIPNFNSTTYNYRVEVPFDAVGIPALVATGQNLNTKIEVKRATSLTSTVEARTVQFIVTAEDDSVQNIYTVELVKEKEPNKVQPFHADPFVSEWVMRSEWNNYFAEIFNPGNQPLDLSNYMITMQWGSDPANHISSKSTPDDFASRYQKYIPGYKWVDETEWQVNPGYVEPDLSVNTQLMPGDVFTLGHIVNTNTTTTGHPDYVYPPYLAMKKQGINFSLIPDDPILDQHNLQNPWGDQLTREQNLFSNPHNFDFMIFEILNDSIQRGLKPATDPNDFRLIEIVGAESGRWIIGGEKEFWAQESMRRKPEVYKPNPVVGASLGTTMDDTEWDSWHANDWLAWGFPYGHWRLGVVSDIGKHYMIEPTHYKSTVTSPIYKVSDGYSWNEEIRGMVTGTIVSDFLDNIIKANEDQTLTIKANGDGTELTGSDILHLGDTLIVLSADSVNTSKYILDVSEYGLSSNAILTSDIYDITIENDGTDGEPGIGTISGFDYGTALRTIVNNVDRPEGAEMVAINEKDAYVPLQILNFDTVYVSTTVKSNIYFEVIAEDGVTKIVYQLLPATSQSDAFVLSDVYSVSQSENLIQHVPGGTNAQTFISNLVASTGASFKLVDKMGYERVDGTIYADDKIVVTSANGSVNKVYHIEMRGTEPETSYLAYVLSNAYAVDQVDYVIEGPTGSTDLAEFYANIIPARGATATVVDSEGVEKTAGDLNDGDMLRVTSADGRFIVMYELALDLTSIDKLTDGKIQLYPNPTTGKVNIRGLENDTHIQVFNQVGSKVRDLKSNKNLEIISLDNQSAGIYLIVLTKDGQMVGQYKVIRR